MKILKAISILLILTILLAFAPARSARAQTNILYAKPNGLTSGDCDSWVNACTLAYVLDEVAGWDDQIWVMKGTHTPTTSNPDPRMATFQLDYGLSIYGGFAGTETALTQRNPDPATNDTILSGDIGVSGDNSDNSYSVISSEYTWSDDLFLDGFTVSDGNSTDGFGSGMNNRNSSPTLTNVIFSNNSAGRDGGGMYNYDSSPTLINVTFSNNSAGYGGGMLNAGGFGGFSGGSSPILIDVTFSGNKAEWGGGIANSNNSNPILTNVTFSGNTAVYSGGGIYCYDSNLTLTNVIFSGNTADYSGGGLNNSDCGLKLENVTFDGNTATIDGGGIYNNSNNPNQSLKNVTFKNNTARGGGGMHNENGSPILIGVTFSGNMAEWGGGVNNRNSSPILTNVTFSGNTVTWNGGGMFNENSSPTITNVTFKDNKATQYGGGIANIGSNSILKNVILWGDSSFEYPEIYYESGSVSITDSVVESSCPTGTICTNIITTDPALGALANNGGPSTGPGQPTLTMALGAGSSAIDTGGVNSTCASTDQRGAKRPAGLACDIGAYELVAFTFASAVTVEQEVDQNDPTSEDPINFTATFDEPIDPATFIATDMTLGSTALDTLSAVITQISPYNGTTFNIAVSGMTNTGTVTASIAANKVEDFAGNLNTASTSTDNEVTYDITGPTVTVEQTLTQSDPTSLSPINFTATFDEPIDVTTFDKYVVHLDGTASGRLSAVITQSGPNNGTTFNIAVSGMIDSGTVTAAIYSGRVYDLVGNESAASTSLDNEVTFDDGVNPIVASTSLVVQYIVNAETVGPSSFTVTFNKNVSTKGGNTGTDSATNPANYRIINIGEDEILQTTRCADPVSGDDTLITPSGVTYAPNTATVSLADPLPVGQYTFFVCGTTSIVDLADNPLNGGSDTTFDVIVTYPNRLPGTGFAPGRITSLPSQPDSKAYSNVEMTLEIPALGVSMPIMGVPQTETSWDVTWLGNSAGWLEGSAYPTWAGNTVLTGHVWDAYNQPGPFAELKTLKYGDRFTINAWGQTYTYEVRENKSYWANTAFTKVFQHEELDWVTLVTCETYNPFNGEYLFRRAVRAVLVSVK